MSLNRFFPWNKPAPVSATEVATRRLSEALIQCDEAAALMAIQAGADVNDAIEPPHVNTTRTFLQHAILNGLTPLTRALLEAGADPMLTMGGCVWPAPHLATLEENREAIDLLRTLPRADFDAPIYDPLVGEASTARDIAARRCRQFTEWFGERFSLTEAARPPEFEDEAQAGLARWRAQRRAKP